MTQFEQQSSDLIDYRKMKDSAGFVLRSVRRHWLVAAAVFTFVVVGTGAWLAVMPKSFRVETRLLIQFDPLLGSLWEPGRAPSDGEASPLRSAVDMITARDNLVALIQRTDLLDEWSRHRAPALRAKDFLVLKLFGEVSPKDRLEAMVNLLRKRLVVWVETGGQPNQGSVNIAINWPDGHMAFRLIEAVQHGYIEARHVADMSAITEVNSILATHASAWRAEAVAAADELRRARGTRRGQAAAPAQPPPLAPAPVPRATEPPDPEVERLSAVLAAKQRLITDLDDSRLRNLADLQKLLAEQKARYTDRHPSVIGTQERIVALAQESPEVTARRKEAEDLQAELLAHRGKPINRHVERPLPASIPRLELPRRDETEEPEVESARARLKFALEKYQDLRARADNATLQLEARRAAFKYRYTVVVPAELPKGPSAPNVPTVGTAAVIAGALLAAFAAVCADLRGGRIVEAWQVERALDLPVLAELTGR